MAHFKASVTSHENTVIINKKSVFYLCCFRVPEELRDQISVSVLDRLERDQIMGFYDKPSLGSHLFVDDLTWFFAKEVHYPISKGARQGRKVPSLLLQLTDQPDLIPLLDSRIKRIED